MNLNIDPKSSLSMTEQFIMKDHVTGNVKGYAFLKKGENVVNTEKVKFVKMESSGLVNSSNLDTELMSERICSPSGELNLQLKEVSDIQAPIKVEISFSETSTATLDETRSSCSSTPVMYVSRKLESSVEKNNTADVSRVMPKVGVSSEVSQYLSIRTRRRR